MSAIEIDRIHKRFGDQEALQDISLSVQAGRRLVLLGPSGAGKTTLLRILAGLERPNEGVLRVDQEDIVTKPPAQRSLAMVSQDYALYPRLSVRKNLQTALKRFRLDRSTQRQRIDETLEWFQISDLADKLPSQLSGGESQRAALAKAIVTRPKMLLLDEPLSQVDGILKAPLTELIREITVTYGCTLVMVTHDPLDAIQLADEIAVLDRGRLIQHGVPSEIYHRPRARVVADLLSPLGMTWFDLQEVSDELRSRLSPLWSSDPGFNSEEPRFVGFRPEDFEWADNLQSEANVSDELETNRGGLEGSGTSASVIEFQATVTDVQNLGFARLLLCDWHGHRIRLLSYHRHQTLPTAVRGTLSADRLIRVPN